ncbi:hypothetical protein [Marinicrinis sediminis]|uniref:S-adenosylmethionine decarboxylase n=1 Tax=Marinicrinis sediminis TaxID=1652465 RepID=A0ABW5R8S7_9BACL
MTRFKKMLAGTVIAVLILVPVYQLRHMLSAGDDGEDAMQMLYEVSLFQIEMLGHHLDDTARLRSTEELDMLKQTAYAAHYVHERLVRSTAGGKLSSLASLQELMAFILRLQIAGARELSATEQEGLQQLADAYDPLFASYRKMMASDGHLYASEVEAMQQADADLSNRLKQLQQYGAES